MSNLKELITRYRDNQALHFLLWCVIGLGIVPAIVSQNISPLDGFTQHFGVAITHITFLPGTVCLLLFLLAASVCIVQRRYWLTLLLLPWLASSFYDLDELSFQMPIYSEAQDHLYENLKLFRESATAPTAKQIRDIHRSIVYHNTKLMPYDEDTLKKNLEGIQDESGISDPDLAKKAGNISSQLKVLARKIAKANTQIRKIKKAIKTTELISHFSFGLTDKRLRNELKRALDGVTKHRNKLISKRNALRAELNNLRQEKERKELADQDLRQLGAELETYLWVSQAYESRQISRMYMALCFMVLLVLIWKQTLGSWVFLATVSASLLVSVLYVEASLTFQLWVVAKFVFLSLIIRFAYQLFIENYPLLRNQSLAFLLQTAKKTLIFYWPFFLLIGLGIFVSAQINSGIDRAIYAISPMENSDTDSNTRRLDIDKAIEDFFREKERTIHQDLDDLSAEVGNNIEAIRTGVPGEFDNTIKPELPDYDQGLKPEGCEGFFDPLFAMDECIERKSLEVIGNGYEDFRDDQRASLVTFINTSAKRARSGEELIRFAKEDISENLRATKLSIKKQLNHLYTVIDINTGIGWLLLILFIVKSLAYIFARIFFSSDVDGKRVIQFEVTENLAQNGKVTVVADRLELTPDMGQQMYVSKKFDFNNAPPDEVTPQAHKAFFSRFKNGVWHMNNVDFTASNHGDTPYRLIPDDERIVAWTLKPGDAVIFSWKNFVGMSDAINIRTQFSWQLSSLIFGRMFFVVATVDPDSSSNGTLLLQARGIDGAGEETHPSSAPEQLLIWQTTTRFQLHARLSMRNVYRSGVQIQAQDADLAVIHLNDKKKKSGVGKMLKYFLVPI